MQRLEILWNIQTIRYATSSGSGLAIDCIILHELLIIILPILAISQLVNTVVNRLARWSIEAAGIVVPSS